MPTSLKAPNLVRRQNPFGLENPFRVQVVGDLGRKTLPATAVYLEQSTLKVVSQFEFMNPSYPVSVQIQVGAVVFGPPAEKSQSELFGLGLGIIPQCPEQQNFYRTFLALPAEEVASEVGRQSDEDSHHQT